MYVLLPASAGGRCWRATVEDVDGDGTQGGTGPGHKPCERTSSFPVRCLAALRPGEGRPHTTRSTFAGWRWTRRHTPSQACRPSTQTDPHRFRWGSVSFSFLLVGLWVLQHQPGTHTAGRSGVSRVTWSYAAGRWSGRWVRSGSARIHTRMQPTAVARASCTHSGQGLSGWSRHSVPGGGSASMRCPQTGQYEHPCRPWMWNGLGVLLPRLVQLGFCVVVDDGYSRGTQPRVRRGVAADGV